MKVLIITKYTFIEIYKSRILVNVVLLGMALLAISLVATEFTYGVPAKVALDFGLGTTIFSSVAIAIFMGSNLLIKEIENRTLYMVLSRPVGRAEFLSGRILGLLLILLLNILILMTITLSLYFYLDGEFTHLIIWNFVYTYLECSIVLLIVILLSMVTNQTLAVINTIAIYVCGHAIGQVHQLQFAKDTPWIQGTVTFMRNVLPDFSKLNIKPFLIYKKSLPSEYLFTGLTYGLVYSLLIYLVSLRIFKKKSLD